MVLVLWVPWVDLWCPSTIKLRDINIKLWLRYTSEAFTVVFFSPLLIISRPNWFLTLAEMFWQRGAKVQLPVLILLPEVGFGFNS